jgi:putative transposase
LSNRDIKDKQLTSHIKYHWIASGGHSGYRNIHMGLPDANINCGRDRVLRLMQLAGIKALRGYKAPKGCYGGSIKPSIPNLLDRKFDVQASNQWWVSDITYIHTHEGLLFLAVVMDLFARNIVGWSKNSTMITDIILDVLTMAYWRQKPTDKVKLHSDQGSQYNSNKFKSLLKNLNIQASMRRRGHCWDNSPMERFFRSLKSEWMLSIVYASLMAAKQSVINYIVGYYCNVRPHTNNDGLTPNESE